MANRRKVKYRKLLIKISDLQKDEVDRYCRALGLTPNKIMKRSLREFMERNAHLIPEEDKSVSKNQLKLFESGKKVPVQLSILDGVHLDMQEQS